MNRNKLLSMVILNMIIWGFASDASAMRPRTAEEFKRLANQTMESSKAHHQISQEHKKMAKQYRRAMDNANSTLTKAELEDLVEHCETIVKLSEETAQRMGEMSKIYSGKEKAVTG